MPDIAALEATFRATQPALATAAAQLEKAQAGSSPQHLQRANEKYLEALAVADAAGAPWLEALGAQIREADQAIGPCRRAEADLEVTIGLWEKAHRGVPADLIYDRATGDPIDPELVALYEDLAVATAATAWVLAVRAAAVEQFKQRPLEEYLADQAASRERRDMAKAAAVGGLA